jgi:hypothetical protein
MRYRLRTLLIAAAVVPPVLAGIWLQLNVVILIAVCFAPVWMVAESLFRMAVRLEPPEK